MDTGETKAPYGSYIDIWHIYIFLTVTKGAKDETRSSLHHINGQLPLWKP